MQKPEIGSCSLKLDLVRDRRVFKSQHSNCHASVKAKAAFSRKSNFELLQDSLARLVLIFSVKNILHFIKNEPFKSLLKFCVEF